MTKTNIQIAGNVSGSVVVAGGSLHIVNGKVVKPAGGAVSCVYCGTRTDADSCPACGGNPKATNVK